MTYLEQIAHPPADDENVENTAKCVLSRAVFSPTCRNVMGPLLARIAKDAALLKELREQNRALHRRAQKAEGASQRKTSRNGSWDSGERRQQAAQSDAMMAAVERTTTKPTT